MNTFRQAAAVAGFFVVIGLCGIIGGSILTVNTHRFITAASSAPGIVVDLEPSSVRNGTVYHTVFKFTDKNGKTHQCRTSSASDPPPYPAGSQITVLYQLDDPESARIKCFSQLWLWPMILLVWGMLFCVVGIAAFIAAKKTYGND